MDGGVPLRKQYRESHGSHQRGIRVRSPLRHPRQRRSSRRHGLQGIGTRDGITACQMDIKIDGLDYHILETALEQARRGRFHILDKMEEAIPASREDLAHYAPRLTAIQVPVESIGLIIGKVEKPSAASPKRPVRKSTSRTTAQSPSPAQATRGPKELLKSSRR